MDWMPDLLVINLYDLDQAGGLTSRLFDDPAQALRLLPRIGKRLRHR